MQSQTLACVLHLLFIPYAVLVLAYVILMPNILYRLNTNFELRVSPELFLKTLVRAKNISH